MKKLIILFILLGAFQGKAQEIQQSLLSTSGDFFKNESYSISWSLGEIAIETFTQANSILTQGFQQTKLATTGVKENTTQENQISIYPNPAKDNIFLNFDSKEYSWNIVEIYDLTGSKQIQQKIKTPAKKIEIKISNLKSGTYLLHLKSDKNENTKSLLFQIID